MKVLSTCAAMVAVLVLSNDAQAARTSARLTGASKCDECVPTYQPRACRPTIARPCAPTVHTYQRQASCLKPPVCDNGCQPRRSCRPCRRNHGVANGYCQDPNGVCSNGQCGSNDQLGGTGLSRRARRRGGDVCSDALGCAAPGAVACTNVRSSAEACTIAQLIYQSQTACYARQRRAAIRRLAKYNCECHPEIMSAFVYGLNDAVETVRATSAAAIGVQVRRHPGCCSPCTVNALTNALGDCDRRVRRAAEKALGYCGYQVVAANCEQPCTDGVCAPVYSPAPTAAPANVQESAEPAAAPPEEPKAAATRSDNQMHTVSHKRTLKNIFGLLR